jgi:hypothetical protein
MQLDVNGGQPGSLHAEVLADGRWQDPYWNMKVAVVDHLRPDITYFVQQGLVGDDILRAALVAYNPRSQQHRGDHQERWKPGLAHHGQELLGGRAGAHREALGRLGLDVGERHGEDSREAHHPDQ